MTDARFSRRRLLVGIGGGALAASLGACGGGASQPTATTTGGPGPGPRSSDASLRRKIASLLIVGFRGETVAPGDWIARAIGEGLGGVILFDRDQLTGARRNISSPAQVTALAHSLRAMAPGPLIVSIDQEGGQTSRLNPGNGFPATPAEAQIGAINAPATTRGWAKSIARTLASTGITVNFAPVVDLNVNPSSPAIGALGRSFSANLDVVVANATEEIRAHREAGVRTSIKHFPGLGSATGNTDFGVVDVTATWSRTELEPFRRLIAAGMADVVMVAHLLNRHLDPARPASLSPAVVGGLLRGQLGWRGPVVSDDMQAVAITSRYGQAEAATRAIEAGVDLLVFANQQVFNPGAVTQTVDTLTGAVHSGRISAARIDQAVARVDTVRPSR